MHWICVPAIVMTVVGFLWAIPVPQAFRRRVALAQLGHDRGGRGAVSYYFLLSPSLGVGAAVCLVALLFVVRWLDTLAWPLWLTCLAVFVVAWIGQFIGHSIEGKRPSFFKDVQFLLIGPIWLVSHVYRRLGVSY